MSKKRGKKIDVDGELEDNKSVISTDTQDLTSKAKGKGNKKGKGKHVDNSDDEHVKGDHQKKTPVSDEEELPKPTAKKSQKKG